jgi:hypothetical protein
VLFPHPPLALMTRMLRMSPPAPAAGIVQLN